MNTWQIIVGVLMIIVSVIIIAVVLLQQGRRTGIGAISGGADTFFSKNKQLKIVPTNTSKAAEELRPEPAKTVDST